MIYTFTANPALDINTFSNGLIPDKVSRTEGAEYSANGKGLNVTYTMKHYGVDSVILGFFGGFTGEYMVNNCRENGYTVKPVMIDGTTRINMFVAVDGGDYSLVNNGPVVSEKDKEEFLGLISSLDDMELLTINGSAARGTDTEFYKRIFDVCRKKNTGIVLDTASSYLRELISEGPLLIKPNDDELREVFSLGCSNHAEAGESMKKLCEMGAQNVLITLGGRGSYFYDGSKAYFCDSVPVKLKTSVCAGDSFLGCFIAKWYREGKSPSEALRYASASGANTAECAGLGDFSHVEEYKEKINVFEV